MVSYRDNARPIIASLEYWLHGDICCAHAGSINFSQISWIEFGFTQCLWLRDEWVRYWMHWNIRYKVTTDGGT
jgi:hypothetical protein